MENASKALLMAGGILIGVLILALMATLFISAKDMSSTYEKSKQEKVIQQFNVNFTKYLGQDLTIHDVVTICNFTKMKNNKIAEVTIEGKEYYNQTDIKNDVEEANIELIKLSEEYYKVEIVYNLKILEYDDKTGYISKIKIEQPVQKFKCYKKDAVGVISTEYKN